MQCRSVSSQCGASDGIPSSSQECSSAVNPLGNDQLTSSNTLAVFLTGAASSVPPSPGEGWESVGVAGGGVVALAAMFTVFFKTMKESTEDPCESEAPFLVVEDEA